MAGRGPEPNQPNAIITPQADMGRALEEDGEKNGESRSVDITAGTE